ncbi:hypothetical protein [Nocardioides sp. SYSU DS0663]|uniref:hypothetical protein n=1 Tax=Nocardioides sp. SYSU DS0663 TaxID=3416445 RepID=UPI003F4B1CD7
MTLHEELARVADRAPVAQVPADTWDRARRSRRRERLGAAGLAAAVVAVVALVAGPGLPTADPPVADTDVGGLGVPDHLYGVPERLTEQDGYGGWSADLVTDELAVGRAAAAYLLDSGLPVVVDAAEGGYHLLDLPDFTGNQMVMAHGLAPPALALSPDGARLAYSYGVIGPDAATAPIPSGVRVVDLVTGEVEEVPLTAGEGTAVTRLAWSPGGRWLAWAGQVARSWTAGSYGPDHDVVGRIGRDGAPAGSVRIDHDQLALAVGERGVVSWVVDGQLHRWDGQGDPRRTRLRMPGFPLTAAALPDGALALGTEDLAAVLVEDGGTTAIEAAGSLPPVGGGSTDALGAVDDQVLLRTRSLDQAPGELLLLDRDGGSRVVGTVESDVPDTLTVAVDLMSPEEPTVARPEPEWPWSTERWVATIAVGLGGVLLLVLLVRRRALNRAL